MDESLLMSVAATLNLDGVSELEAIKNEIEHKSMFIENKDIELAFDNGQRQIVLTVNHDGKMFSKCLTLFADDTATEVRTKFWRLVDEAENFIAAENLGW